MRIQVEARTGLGDTIIWEGPAEDVGTIKDLEARIAARLTAMSGKPEDEGMYHASVIPDEDG